MRKSSEKGSVLIGVLILVIVVVLVMVAVASFITHGIQRTKITSARLQALYLAEAGVDKAIEQLKEDWDTTFPTPWPTPSPSPTPTPSYYSPFPSGDEVVGGCSFIIPPPDEGSGERIIAGYGKVEIAGRRPIIEKVTMTLKPLALSVSGEINMGSDGSSKIIGNVATNADEEGSVVFPWSAQIVGDLYIGPEADLSKEPGNVIKIESPSLKNNVTGEVGKLPEEREYPSPKFPDYPTLPMHDPSTIELVKGSGTDSEEIYGSAHYTSIEITNNKTLYINTDTGDANDEQVILVDNLSLHDKLGNIALSGSGSGKLKLYVKDIDVEGSSTINGNGDPTRLTLYYGGTDAFTLGGDAKFNGTLVVDKADVTISNGGNFKGNLITGGTNVTVQGDGSVVTGLIYAPNATVKLYNSGKVNGAVVCQNFEASGNARLIYDKSVQNIELPGDVLPSLGSKNIFITSWESGLS